MDEIVEDMKNQPLVAKNPPLVAVPLVGDFLPLVVDFSILHSSSIYDCHNAERRMDLKNINNSKGQSKKRKKKKKKKKFI